MYAVLNLLVFLAGFLRLGITTVKTNPDPIAGIEQDGALVPNGALVAAINALQTNASPAFGNWSQVLIPQSLSATTYTGNQIAGGIIRRLSPAGTTVDSTDTATNIILAIPGAKVNQSFPLFVANMGSSALQVAAGTGVTMAGTNVISGFSVRLFLGQITGSAAVTMTGLFSMQLGSGL